jgi:hypothetical protein
MSGFGGPIPIEFLTQDQIVLINQQCASQACLEAKIALKKAQNDVLKACNDVAAAKGRRDTWAAALAAAVVAATALTIGAATATATIFGIAAGIVLGIAAAVMWVTAAILAIVVGVLVGEVDAAVKVLAGNQSAVNTTAEAMMNVCDVHCWADATLPACP